MKSFLICLGVPILATALSCLSFAEDTDSKPAPERVLRHVVAFKFKESAAPDAIKQVETAFAALPAKIQEIKGYEWGLNNSPEGLNKGCTHGFILTFHSEADRDAYLIHPDHKEFGKLVRAVLDDVFVIDFWAATK